MRQKKLTKWNFVSMISQLKNYLNSKILVPTPHNTLVIMWGRDKNFSVSMIFQLRNLENKISLSEVFFAPLLTLLRGIFLLFFFNFLNFKFWDYYRQWSYHKNMNCKSLFCRCCYSPSQGLRKMCFVFFDHFDLTGHIYYRSSVFWASKRGNWWRLWRSCGCHSRRWRIVKH